MQAIKAATSVSAGVMQWADRVGTIQEELYGDIVAVKGDPLADISDLENVDIVIKGGCYSKRRKPTNFLGRLQLNCDDYF